MAETNYDPNATYKLTDENGNVTYSKGDNGYVWQAVTQGIPIYINENGPYSPYPDERDVTFYCRGRQYRFLVVEDYSL